MFSIQTGNEFIQLFLVQNIIRINFKSSELQLNNTHKFFNNIQYYLIETRMFYLEPLLMGSSIFMFTNWSIAYLSDTFL